MTPHAPRSCPRLPSCTLRAALPFIGAALLATPLLPLAGCDEKSGGTSQPATREDPKTPLGKSAAMARDTKAAVEAQSQNAAAAAGAVAGGDMTVIGGMRFAVPASWQKGDATGMRAATYKVSGDGGAAEVVFFVGIGGDAGSNITRWAGQVKRDDGAPSMPIGGMKTMTVGAGTKVTKVAFEGTYAAMTPMGGAAAPQPGTRFLGAIIEPAGGSAIHVRMTGPIAVVEAVEKDWDAMIASVQPK
jgi:hypothetical protein